MVTRAIILTGGLALAACGSGGSSEDSGGGTAGGNGGVGGSSSYDAGTPYEETDDYVTRMIAGTARNMLTFLWNRDMPTPGSSQVESVSLSGPCLLTGSYSATGTATWLTGNCSGTGGPDLTYQVAACEHDDGQIGESVIISGELQSRVSSVYAGSCSEPESTNSTMTGDGLEVTFVRDGSEPFERTFHDCSIELNYVHSSQSASLNGRVCDVPVQIDYAN